MFVGYTDTPGGFYGMISDKQQPKGENHPMK